MEGSIAEELYSESLKLSKMELGPNPSSSANDKESDSHDVDDLQHEDVPIWDSSDEEVVGSSELDREWQRRHDQFHTHGYREGISAGKEASAQEGFNIGFKQSVLAGYNWGIVRGVTSALASLPDELKEKLIETQEKRNEFKGLYESVHSISTADALRLFNDDFIAKKAQEQSENAEASSHVPGLQEQSSDCSRLENYFGELQSLLSESPALKVHFLVDK
ncbi:yae1 domain-containing protein 1 [Fagus crenata]